MSAPTLPISPSPESVHRVLVKTTLPAQPLPSNSARLPITTARLTIRPWLASDLAQLRILRTQPEVMKWTRAGHIDLDEAATQAWLARFLPPDDSLAHNCAITLTETGELIGAGGVHSFRGEHGWPEVGYMFRSDFWGKGYAAEFLRAFAEGWAALPREEVEILVDPRTAGADGKTAEEQLVATAEDSNGASQRVLRKCGWEHFLTWLGDKGNTLQTFRYFPARSGKAS